MNQYNNSSISGDLIAPSILVPRSACVISGGHGLGKTDLLLSWISHLVTGKHLLGMRPLRPLKVAYVHKDSSDVNARVRIPSGFKSNFSAVSCSSVMDKDGVELMAQSILNSMKDGVDIVAIDSLDVFFDGTRAEMDGMARMRNFEVNRLEVLRNAVNPDCGIILVNDITSPTKGQLEEDAFYEFTEVCNLSIADISMLRVPGHPNRRKLTFELSLGAPIEPKLIEKINGEWCEVECADCK